MEETFNKDHKIVYLNSLEATSQLGYNVIYENISEGVIKFKVKSSNISWGEIFTIKVTKIDDSKTHLVISSSTRFQLYDWGKNKKNMENFMTLLNSLFKK